MAVVRQVLDTNAINVQLHGPHGGVARDMLRRGLRVQTVARRLAPADTGRLRADISIATAPRNVGGIATIGVLVGTSVRYAIFVHDGTGIYGPRNAPIRPHGSVLVFKNRDTGRLAFSKSTGRSYHVRSQTFVKSVRGQRAVPFLKDALTAARG